MGTHVRGTGPGAHIRVWVPIQSRPDPGPGKDQDVS